ncbi:helix-turn-helix transcriptional regulator [Pedobacter nyackensis]|uniref:helix-turn-helix domain-containing protein n=1 Tax=Pedobacter nyackensis TaxID=475255 RepID=UPI00292F2D71|nr:helix-turn-helix transcriptional regulator [Pedobacter nyackensis]
MISNKGDVIERIVRTKIGISELSRILHVSRTSIYNWFEHGHLSLETICKIGQAINYDFSNEFPEEFAKGRNHVSTGFSPGSDTKTENGDSSVHYWMNKYISLLEKYNEILTNIAKSDTKADLNNAITFNNNGQLDQRDHKMFIS